MAKREKLLSKIVMILFMLLIVVGFTVPLFSLSGDDNGIPSYVEPRLCQADPDCYLVCDNTPMKVLCLQNMCQINSCEEYNLYPYQEEAVSFYLSIEVDNEMIDLSLHSNSLDLFTKFIGDKVEVYTSGLSLGHILEKVDISVNGQCLTVSGEEYCSGDGKELSLSLNGEEFYDVDYYVPQEGDLVEIEYS